MGAQFYVFASAILRASVAASFVALTGQSIPFTHAQRPGRDSTRQLVQPPLSVPNRNTEKRVALVIGNSGYRNAPHLANPGNDAHDMSDALRSLGFEVLLREDLSADDMRAVIKLFGEKLRNGGIGFFYYAGHGVQVNGRNYLIPIDRQKQLAQA